MDDREAYDNDARFLAEMMAQSGGAGGLWRPEEMAAILRHQLDAPLAFDLDTLEPGLAQRLGSLSQAEGPLIRTFRDLFAHPHPPVELLNLARQFAKACAGRPDAPVPEEIANILYTLSIVAAMTRCGLRITELDDQELRRRLDWALARPWLDEATRNLLREGRQAVGVAAPCDAKETHLAGPSVEPRTPGPVVMGGTIGDLPPGMSAAQVRPTQLGEYTLLEKLGHGGMGTVYKAVHTELDRLVAVKVMRQGQVEADWAEARFRREIKAVAALDHPNIVRAHDARRIADTYFLVMEYVDGLDLNELVDRRGPLAVADACELARQAALGLQAAYEHGLVHRDIKPSNLMLNRQGQVKILDLGLARVHAAGNLSGETTAAGQVMGTPDYMAPEQASDSHAVDIRADIYSLGCTLYKLLTGSAPFGGPEYHSLLAKLTAHREQMPPPIQTVRPDVPAELIAVLERMLAKSPEERLSTPADVAEALDRWAQGADLCRLLSQAELGDAVSGTGEVCHVQGDAATAAVRQTRIAQQEPKPASPASRRRLVRLETVAAALVLLALLGGVAFWLTSRPVRDIGIAARERPSDDSRLPLAGEGQGVRVFGNKEQSDSSTAAKGPDAPKGRREPVNATSGQAGERSPGWIVLSWTRPRMGKPNLWLVSPDGKQRVNITNDPRYYDIHPKFSPDARRIVFARGESLTAPNGVYVCNADGSGLRVLVGPQDKSERFASPLWVSDSLVYYCRDPKPDREPDMEVWQVDLSGGAPRRVFRFQDALGKEGGVITDVSPDGRRLAIIAQSSWAPSSSNVYVTDLEGKNIQTVWADRPDEWRDTRALWSPDGARIAWHHNFTRGMLGKPIYHGVGIARWEPEGRWMPRLQPQPEVFVTPLAWSPRGDCLLCARVQNPEEKLSPVTLFLMDDRFRSVRELFPLEASPWQPAHRDLGRLADWAIVPPDVAIGTGR